MSKVIAFPGVARITSADVAAIRQHYARGLLPEGSEVEACLDDQGAIEAVHVSTAAGEPLASFGVSDGRWHAVGAAETGQVLGTAATLRGLFAAMAR